MAPFICVFEKYIWDVYNKTKNGVHKGKPNVNEGREWGAAAIGMRSSWAFMLILGVPQQIEDRFEDAPPGPRHFQMGLSRRCLYQH